jgi:hypothetical protein
MNVCLSFVTIGIILELGNGFYLPGVAPRSFFSGEEVELKVNKLRLKCIL